ncbi:MAG TPA: methylated-DNA--[protein]-cysteine S-methyltransferase [Thermoanaerobaculia bacterium]|jgi:methylated-DNA-[protein]-cysteine S-methyltransferase|nr:methylated-DNA--[protein]-cysteine S-methyltransferase [Thermoanaerobaculia bacterium]
MTDPAFCYDLFEDALGFAVSVARGGCLVGLGHHATRELSEEYRERHWPRALFAPEAEPLPAVRAQLAEYLAGRRREFDLPLDLAGTEFQQACWQELLRIPFGTTRTYGELAQRIGRPAAVRAVGQANHNNPIGVIVPCHRVIGANGSLTGYGGGLPMKRVLLELEGVLPPLLPGARP